MARHFKELVAWQRGMDLVTAVYVVSRGFPREEAYGLTSQVRRAAVSIPSNIAEGQGRGSTADFVRFLHIAQGSTQEVETQLLIAERLGYVRHSDLATATALIDETGRIIAGLLRSLEDSLATSH